MEILTICRWRPCSKRLVLVTITKWIVLCTMHVNLLSQVCAITKMTLCKLNSLFYSFLQENGGVNIARMNDLYHCLFSALWDVSWTMYTTQRCQRYVPPKSSIYNISSQETSGKTDANHQWKDQRNSNYSYFKLAKIYYKTMGGLIASFFLC